MTTKHLKHIITSGIVFVFIAWFWQPQIQSEQVILEKTGQRIILKLDTSPWLNAKRPKARQR